MNQRLEIGRFLLNTNPLTITFLETIFGEPIAKPAILLVICFGEGGLFRRKFLITLRQLFIYEVIIMKSKYITLFFVLVILILTSSIALAAPAPKVDVCHLDETGSYILININENAFQAHVDHGDGGPGDLVPGMPGKMFADDCAVIDANENVAETWRGESGITGTMGYWFYMYLNQDGAGNVTGTVNYDIGIVRTVTGSISGDQFTFVTHDNPSDPTQAYWADCTPCTVSVGGTYFHGYGTSSSSQNIEWEASK
jgi:hypothetical protein